ncbi:MAG: 16S rRNA (cytidine(1402)-2'-O)-methyltransferase [Amphiplicatus sp.]
MKGDRPQPATRNLSPMALEPGLYVAATPIGNLKDVTFRVVETLKEADVILCEDTRQTAKLCSAYGIRTPRIAYHDHNAARARPEILERLKAGARVALVSDAGTPLIADPGYKLVSAARALGIKVVPLPGASALTAAMSASGAPTDRFLFAGFPPAKARARARFLEALAGVDASLVFYETAPRLPESLAAMAAAFGARRAVVARELTKLHEEFVEGDLPALAAAYAGAAPKGEIVIVIHPPQEEKAEPADIEAFLDRALLEMSVRDAAEAAASALGASKKDAYQMALRKKGEG